MRVFLKMYKFIIKKFLFLFDPEWVHHLVFNLIKYINLIPGVNKCLKYFFVLKDKRLERKVFGLNFINPVGLAAGFDKDAKLYNELTNFGFWFYRNWNSNSITTRWKSKKKNVSFNK